MTHLHLIGFLVNSISNHVEQISLIYDTMYL